MKSFRDYLKEDVVPTAVVKDGSIDLEREVVRAQINSSLASVLADPSVTPYNALMRASKVLSYFSIILPKRVYLDGEKGIEAIELRQFGDRMGMTDQGEFIKEVPGKFYLFIQYWRTHPNFVPYAATANFISSTGGMFKVAAKVVDKVELDRLIDMAEVSLSEGAEDRQALVKALAPKEDMHTALGDCDCTQGDSPSTKSAVSVMMRKKDKKLSSGELEEGRMPASVIKHKQKLASMSDKDFAEKHGHKSEKQLRDMGARHGYGFDKATKTGSDHYVKRAASAKQVDEVSLAKAAKTARLRNMGAERSAYASPYDYSPHIDIQKRKAGKTVDRIGLKHGDDKAKKVSDKMNKDTDKVWRGKMEEAYGVYRKGGSIGEKPSKEPHKTFDSAEEAKSHAKGMNKQLSPGEKKYYRIKYHVKSIKEEDTLDEAMGSIKKTYAMKKMKKKVSTQVKQGLGIGKERTNTVLVTNKGDPKAVGGGGVHRIPRDKYDPTKHNLASE